MNRFFVILLGFLVLCGFSFDAHAYFFTIKVKNDTGQDLTLKAAWMRKGIPGAQTCWLERVLNGKSYQKSCSAGQQKWQRQINVSFTCAGQGKRTISFPRKKKWYARDHATSRGDRYTITLKASDC